MTHSQKCTLLIAEIVKLTDIKRADKPYLNEACFTFLHKTTLNQLKIIARLCRLAEHNGDMKRSTVDSDKRWLQ